MILRREFVKKNAGKSLEKKERADQYNAQFREFLLFAEEHRGCTFEQTLNLFLLALGERVGIQSRQIQHAAQETVSATQDERGLQMDEKPKEQEERAVETAKKVGRKIA